MKFRTRFSAFSLALTAALLVWPELGQPQPTPE